MTRELVWLFDLDNTLHDASHAIFPAINGNMNALIARVLAEQHLPSHSEAVNAVRVRYWKQYGATLLGMVRHHGVRADEFLREAHQFDDLRQMIRTERGIGKLLSRLPGRKILLTNAPRAYAQQVLRHLGLHRHFAEHVPIEAMRVHGQWRPKPSKLMLRRLLRRQGLEAGRCVLVEDTLENLKSARSLRMRTVWFSGFSPRSFSRPGFADVQVKSLHQLPRRLAALR
ncbi:MAG: pyrimidine 5'-nucleotidase [Burkholderiaceae bacterium]|nr:pyrimidine 5'-nucleotidase [Burkholderiaceae bacterium]